jgi:hypothetical protein
VTAAGVQFSQINFWNIHPAKYRVDQQNLPRFPPSWPPLPKRIEVDLGSTVDQRLHCPQALIDLHHATDTAEAQKESIGLRRHFSLW